ncbi:pro-Pol polyprotein [Trichonephila clavipes]|nr:pro-Pol polyprotein [Trichonephila clavipes]
MFTHSEKIEHFWDLELLGIKEPTEKTSREEVVVKFFNDTLSTDFDGRYMEDILIIIQFLKVGKLTRSLKKVSEGGREGRCHYLPHCRVYKECSTIQLRPVFDAACKEKGKFSLNDCLEKGLNLLDTIPSILMRFREKKIGIISDIKKAFLQISICPKDRFFWQKDYEESKMKIYCLRRLVFGLSCSQFLLRAVINNLLENCPQEYRVIAEILKKCFYVDNCVTFVDAEELSEFVNGATELMKFGNFKLREWENTSKDADSVPSHVLRSKRRSTIL